VKGTLGLRGLVLLHTDGSQQGPRICIARMPLQKPFEGMARLVDLTMREKIARPLEAFRRLRHHGERGSEQADRRTVEQEGRDARHGKNKGTAELKSANVLLYVLGGLSNKVQGAPGYRVPHLWSIRSS
jgi:hypothetical protein